MTYKPDLYTTNTVLTAVNQYNCLRLSITVEKSAGFEITVALSSPEGRVCRPNSPCPNTTVSSNCVVANRCMFLLVRERVLIEGVGQFFIINSHISGGKQPNGGFAMNGFGPVQLVFGG
jgi:hypothetical protein